ncbi:hypothetical protein SAMN04489752_2413 [Brevibacterium siliguriense]|uniref:FtsX-like permease family protein n=1 Tax=Brevibacterium siliguriense TaxID=1136497 RepID=A0A1H1URG0_9MICO|nr:hypothetical protein [Brevibacterium siliguriense]SDS74746.1 hypothetical protein SAMN04489752_2413 [Brevibacterium siliguriense]
MRDLQKNWPYMLMKIVILGLVSALIYQVAAFASVSSSEISRSFSDEAEVDMYSITDTLVDPDDFSSYRESAKSLDAVGSFYNLLDSDSGMKFLSVFDQPLSIVDFPHEDGSKDVPKSIDATSEAEYVDEDTGQRLTDVQSFQMNQNAYEFNSLKVETGAEISWSNVDYESRTIPVVLGHSYESVYDIGDRIEAQYYFEDFSLVVAGFLEPNSSIYYQGELNTYLDDSVVVPYPPRLEAVTKDNQEFFGMLSFAMISGDLAVDQEQDSESVFRRLGQAASESGFEEYTVLNAPTYLVQFQLTRQLIQDNAGLLIGVAILLGVCAVFSNGLISLHLARRRWNQQRLEYVLGVSTRRTAFRIVAVSVLEYSTLLIIASVIALQVPQGSSVGLFPVALVVAAVSVTDVSLQLFLRKRSIDRQLFTKDSS